MALRNPLHFQVQVDLLIQTNKHHYHNFSTRHSTRFMSISDGMYTGDYKGDLGYDFPFLNDVTKQIT